MSAKTKLLYSKVTPRTGRLISAHISWRRLPNLQLIRLSFPFSFFNKNSICGAFDLHRLRFGSDLREIYEARAVYQPNERRQRFHFFKTTLGYAIGLLQSEFLSN